MPVGCAQVTMLASNFIPNRRGLCRAGLAGAHCHRRGDAPAALASDEPDFEDGLLRSAAELSGCDYLLTRDAPGFLAATFQKVDAAALLGALS